MSVQTIKKEKLEYLVSENISVPHCFTTRHGGVSAGIYESMNLAVGNVRMGAPLSRDRSWRKKADRDYKNRGK